MKRRNNKTSDNHNPINKLGTFGVDGGPGRPKGLKNKYTKIKQDMLEVWEEENGKERFRKLFTGTKTDFIKALDKILILLPKEPIDNADENAGRSIVLIRSPQAYNAEALKGESDIRSAEHEVQL